MHHAIRLAADLGQQQGGEFCSDVFEEMEIQFLLKAHRHHRFTEGFTSGRLRENLLIVAPPAMGKSFSSETFLTKCIGAVPYSDPRAQSGRVPVYAQLDGASITLESLRGGATTSGRPIVPLILCTDFLFCSDLPTFLGTGENRSRALSFILTMGEDGTQDVILSKMEEFDDEAAGEFERKSKSINGMTYVSAPRRGYRLQAAVPFIFNCTPQELREGRDSLETRGPGALSRFTQVESSFNDEQIEEMWTNDPSDIDFTALREQNLTIWRTPIHSIPFPDQRLHGALSSWYLNEAKSIARENGVPLNRIINRRHSMRIARLMVAHAIARTFADRAVGDTAPIKRLLYEDADREFARSHIERLLAHMSERTAEGRDVAMREESSPAVAAYATFLRTLQSPWPILASRGAFVAHCRATGINEKTVANYLSDLKGASIISRKRGADEIRTDAAWLSSHGFREPRVDSDEVEELRDEREEERETA